MFITILQKSLSSLTFSLLIGEGERQQGTKKLRESLCFEGEIRIFFFFFFFFFGLWPMAYYQLHQQQYQYDEHKSIHSTIFLRKTRPIELVLVSLPHWSHKAKGEQDKIPNLIQIHSCSLIPDFPLEDHGGNDRL